MQNKYLKNLNKIEFVVTYACTGRCKHCSEGEHVSCGERIDPQAAACAVEKIAAEFVYMHAINENAALAEESAKGCGEYLNDMDSLTACRICAAFHKVKGEIEEAKLCIEQALDAMANERMAGVRKFEEILLSRI